MVLSISYTVIYQGQYIYEEIEKTADLKVAFVWNRSTEKLKEVPKDLILENLSDFKSRYVFSV